MAHHQRTNRIRSITVTPRADQILSQESNASAYVCALVERDRLDLNRHLARAGDLPAVKEALLRVRDLDSGLCDRVGVSPARWLEAGLAPTLEAAEALIWLDQAADRSATARKVLGLEVTS